MAENKNYYIQIADWMLDLELSFNELLIYAIIYGYNQTGNNCYYGSKSTLAMLIGLTKSQKGHASEYLDTLEEKNLIRRESVKKPGKQKMDKFYVTTDRKGPVDTQDVDYITIQPWMFNIIHLRNNLLIIYARIQCLSRANNIYFYDDEDLAKWARCRKNKIRGYINKLMELNHLKTIELIDLEGYKAIIPPEVDNNQKWNTCSENGTQVQNNPKCGTENPENGNNNNTNISLDNNKKDLDLSLPIFDSEERRKQYKQLLKQINSLNCTRKSMIILWNKIANNNFKTLDGEPIKNMTGYMIDILSKNPHINRKPIAKFPDYSKIESKLKVTKEEVEEALRRRDERVKNKLNKNDSFAEGGIA